MTTPRIFALATAVAATLLLTACATGPAATTPTETPTAQGPAEGPCTDADAGVTFVVDSSALEGGSSAQWCIPADDTIAASEVLAAAGTTVEGTEEYGDQVVCRVDGLPSATEPVGSTEDPAYIESCASMPAAFAYWSLWVQPAGGEWGYAQEGLATLQVEPGDSLELLFTLDGAPAAP